MQAQELKNTFQQAMQFSEGLINADGAGDLDVIPSTATVNNATGSGQSLSSIVGLNNAMQFTDQQTLQVFPSIGGTSRGSFVVSYVDPVTNTIYSAGALPSGTATGDYLMVAGCSGAAGSSILGLRAWDVNSNTGTIGGLSRASYPSRLSTPTINLNGAAISVSTASRAVTILGRALGPESDAIKNAIWYCGPDQAMAIQNLYINVQYANVPEVKGDTSVDMAKRNWPATFGGRELHVGWNALPGRLDLFTPDTWYLGELLPLELYDFGGGVTVAPVPDVVSGGYLTSSMFAYVSAFNLVNSNLRAALYIQNASQPTI